MGILFTQAQVVTTPPVHPRTEQAIECQVVSKPVPQKKGETWLFLNMPDGKRVQIRITGCVEGTIQIEETPT